MHPSLQRPQRTNRFSTNSNFWTANEVRHTTSKYMPCPATQALVRTRSDQSLVKPRIATTPIATAPSPDRKTKGNLAVVEVRESDNHQASTESSQIQIVRTHPTSCNQYRPMSPAEAKQNSSAHFCECSPQVV